MAEDPKRVRATLVDAGWDTPPPPPVPPPPPIPGPAARSGVMMTPIPPPRKSVVPVPPPPRSAPPPAAAPRQLPEYGFDGPAADATRVDTDMEARARAMLESVVSQSDPAPALAPGPAALVPPVAPSAHDALYHHQDAVPGFRAAMLLRVRFLHGDVPLWSLVTPLVIVAALAAAFAVAAVSTLPHRDTPGPAQTTKLATPEPVAPAPVNTPTPEPSATAAQAKEPTTASGELPTLDSISGKLKAAEVMDIAAKRAGRDIAQARALADSLDRDPTLAQDDKTQAEIRRLLDNQETSRLMLGVIAAMPGPVSADLLYEVWTGTVLRNETTDLAKALLFSEDVRPKASPALAVSLDLRQAERCEDNQKIVPRAIEHGDRRALHLLIKLTRRYGCGANKRDDCYPCLRDSDALDQAVKAVKNRREPKTFGRR